MTCPQTRIIHVARFRRQTPALPCTVSLQVHEPSMLLPWMCCDDGFTAAGRRGSFLNVQVCCDVDASTVHRVGNPYLVILYPCLLFCSLHRSSMQIAHMRPVHMSTDRTQCGADTMLHVMPLQRVSRTVQRRQMSMRHRCCMCRRGEPIVWTSLARLLLHRVRPGQPTVRCVPSVSVQRACMYYLGQLTTSLFSAYGRRHT